MKLSRDDILDDLVATTRDGKGFYEDAATRVESTELQTLFAHIARVKGEIVQRLLDEGLSEDRREDDDHRLESGTWAGDFSRLYFDIRDHLGDQNHVYVYVARLEESEEQLVKAFFRFLDKADTSTHVKTAISRLFPEVRHCHELMKAEKFALKKAA